MGDTINLKLVRKRKARAEAEEQAARNRAAHGRSKDDKELSEARAAKAARELDGHKRER